MIKLFIALSIFQLILPSVEPRSINPLVPKQAQWEGSWVQNAHGSIIPPKVPEQDGTDGTENIFQRSFNLAGNSDNDDKNSTDIDRNKIGFELPDINIEIPELKLPELDFSGLKFPEIDLTKLELPKLDFGDGKLRKIDFSGLNLPKLNFGNLELPKVQFASRSASNMEQENMELPKIDLSELNLPKIDLSNLNLPKIDLSELNLPEIDLNALNLPKINLTDLNLSDIELAEFGSLTLPKIDLENLELPDIDLDSLKSVSRDDVVNFLDQLQKEFVKSNITSRTREALDKIPGIDLEKSTETFKKMASSLPKLASKLPKFDRRFAPVNDGVPMTGRSFKESGPSRDELQEQIQVLSMKVREIELSFEAYKTQMEDKHADLQRKLDLLLNNESSP